jgi:branched-chain amino acid transport system substrate-binding protein
MVQDVIKTLKATRPEAVVLVCSARDVAFWVRIMAEEGIAARILSAAWAQTEAFLAEAGPLARDVLFASPHMPTDTTVPLRAFCWEYQKRFGIAPSFAAVRAYDAVQFLAFALKDALARKENLPEALAQPRTMESLYGPLTINGFGDASGLCFLVGVREGRFVVLEFLPGVQP